VHEPEPEVAAAPLIDNAELARREEEARRQAELIRRQEEELAEKRRQREEQEAREREAAERAAALAAEAAAAAAQKAQAQVIAAAPSAPAVKEAAEVAATSAAAEVDAQARAQTDAREKAAAESKARADEEAARAADLSERRRKAEAEAAAIRSMMATPKKVLVAKKPEEPKPVAKPAEAAKADQGHAAQARRQPWCHRPLRAPHPLALLPQVPGKEVKSAKLSSSWAGDPAKKKEIKTRGDSVGWCGPQQLAWWPAWAPWRPRP
jgi:translation initiation factor IF-2